MRRRAKVKVAVISIRKLIFWVYVVPVLVIALLFMIFILWAFTPENLPFVGLKETTGNLDHIQIRYNLSPYSNAHDTLDQYANCALLDRSVYNIPGDPVNYYHLSCDGRRGYVDEVNLRWNNR